jgi:hypothetical protein
MKRLLPLLLCGALMGSEQEFNIKTLYKRGAMPGQGKSIVLVNDKEVRCNCGESPKVFMLMGSHLEAYCFTHMPEVEMVRPFNIEEYQALVQQGNYHNGAHQG